MAMKKPSGNNWREIKCAYLIIKEQQLCTSSSTYVVRWFPDINKSSSQVGNILLARVEKQDAVSAFKEQETFI